MLVVTLVLVALVLGLNLVATFVVLGREEVSAGGRTVQLLLVWLLPLVGAILCLAVATADGSGSRGDGGGSHDTSVGYASDNHSHHSYSSSDCSSDGGSGDGGSCGGGD